MNKLTIIGNLTRDPELRTTSTGINVCDFTVAVNRRRTQNNTQPEADFFRVTAWRQLGELVAKYLTKGRKVCVVGSVSVHAFTGNDGQPRASLEVQADEIEFLSPRPDNSEPMAGVSAPKTDAPVAAAPAAEFTAVENEELPF